MKTFFVTLGGFIAVFGIYFFFGNYSSIQDTIFLLICLVLLFFVIKAMRNEVKTSGIKRVSIISIFTAIVTVVILYYFYTYLIIRGL